MSTNHKRGSKASSKAIAARSWFIAGPRYDTIFFLLSPLVGLGLAYWARQSGVDAQYGVYRDATGVPQRLFLIAGLSAVLTHAHLVIVLARSHLNTKIFRLYPWRFTLVPLGVFAASVASSWVFVVATFVAFWWDAYHSSLQTFGLGRIYDQRAGNGPTVGRRADYWFNLVAYCAPIFAGASLSWHLSSFDKFRALEADALVRFGNSIFEQRAPLRLAMIVVGAVTLLAYVVRYVVLIRRGYRYPPAKLVLFGATAFVSVLAWGFGSLGDFVLTMNFFHAIQYFAIVWWAEKANLTRLALGVWPLALLVLVVGAIAYGVWRANPIQASVPLLALGNVIALMHFWYDGFIWSVRKGQI